ncbi:DNA-binding HxlR family transcriptional regulator [Actinokineospora auranticolor]|uniref:DNA-binding HxlR family transcriptional regulator n=2 Tax=Actinokineospora auranticolor TaxID=155976 RepID=A0A2S6GSC3_9PSEU|nr:DNA-binding HxlR family transcriptional regulator [Actinokineospora auranticolor]
MEEGTPDRPRYRSETDQVGAAQQLMGVLCPTRDVLGRIGDKWTVLVVTALDCDGTLRFTKLRARVGDISQKVLTQALRNLERDGLVARRVHPTVPVTVEYSLTDLGQSLAQVARVIGDWSCRHIDEIVAARAAYDTRVGDGPAGR